VVVHPLAALCIVPWPRGAVKKNDESDVHLPQLKKQSSYFLTSFFPPHQRSRMAFHQRSYFKKSPMIFYRVFFFFDVPYQMEFKTRKTKFKQIHRGLSNMMVLF
jgi:hypothetical protein